MLDIDNFKLINDTHGHLVGDEVLRTTAKRLNVIARQTDILGRYGGEEFGVLLPETTLDGAQLFAERIRSIVEEAAITYGESAIKVTISSGIAQYHGEMTKYEELIKEADDALYQAKKAGRNCVVCSEQSKMLSIVSNGTGGI